MDHSSSASTSTEAARSTTTATSPFTASKTSPSTITSSSTTPTTSYSATTTTSTTLTTSPINTISSSSTPASSEEEVSASSCSPLSMLLAARAASLRRCTTVVTRPDGRCYEETRFDQGFTALTSSYQGHNPGEAAPTTPGLASAPVVERVAGVQTNQSLRVASHGQPARMSLQAEGNPTVVQGGPGEVMPHSRSYVRDGNYQTGTSDVLFNKKCPGFVIDTKPDLRCSVILPYLLLGSQDVASESSILNQFKVTHILSLVPPSLFNSEPQNFLQSDGTVVTTRTSSDEGVRSSDCIDHGHSLEWKRSFQDADAGLQGYLGRHAAGLAGHSDSNVALSSSTQPPEVIHAPMLDTPEHQILESFPACHRFLAGVKRAGGVALVHCNAGVSRAPTVVIAYLMTEYGWSYEEAQQMVLEKRTFIRPNAGFVKQLKQYQSLLKSKNA